jgi:hypothetical protein
MLIKNAFAPSAAIFHKQQSPAFDPTLELDLAFVALAL